MQDGKLKFAAEEERFSRIKADDAIPRMALKYCLKEAGLHIGDIDCIAFYEDPRKKLGRQLWSGIWDRSAILRKKFRPRWVEREIRDILGYEGNIEFFDHHLSHAASSYHYSGFDNAAIMTVDGVGEWATTTYGMGLGSNIDLWEEVSYPHSLGLLYSTLTNYLGFEVNEGEYKVMGLAPYGTPRYLRQVRELVTILDDGQYALNMEYFDFLEEERMFTDKLAVLFGKPARTRSIPVDQDHMDIARSLQVVLEEILINKALYLHRKTGSPNLCMAGGVALNCVANGKIIKNTPFKHLFVQPAANDAGGALGAASLAYTKYSGQLMQQDKLSHVYLGPRFGTAVIRQMLEATSLRFHSFEGNPEKLLKATAARIADGKVIGWFHGRMEFGPRSLGARSILADPRDAGMRDKINAMVKKREGFRPFAPAALDSEYKKHFDIDHESPFMLETCQVISPIDLPAITHVDGSARLQTVSYNTNPRFHALLEAFYALTGCPILLNTSFNVKGEPIVCTPEDALNCFIGTNIDALVLEDFIIDRDENELDILEWMAGVMTTKYAAARNTYTFI
ncbi:carbamoyltransferase [Chitinophaga japonensis]